MSSKSSNVYVLTNSTCPACIKFKSEQHPVLHEKLSGVINYSLIDFKDLHTISDERVRNIRYRFFPCIVYTSDSSVRIFNGTITEGGETLYVGDAGWEVQDILKWLCDLNMEGTTIVCHLMNDKMEVKIDNPIMQLM